MNLTWNLAFLILGIVAGILTIILLILYLFKIKCPQCKKRKLVKEIVRFDEKNKTWLTGQSCCECRKKV